MTSQFNLIYLFIVIFCFGITTMTNAQDERLPAADKNQILASTFTIITKSSELPDSVKNYISQTYHTKKPFADPGEPFEKCCDSGSGLPMNRLIYAAIDKKYCLFYDECGGAAYKHTLTILRIDQKVAKEIWFTRIAPTGYPNQIQFKTIEQLKKLL